MSHRQNPGEPVASTGRCERRLHLSTFYRLSECSRPIAKRPARGWSGPGRYMPGAGRHESPGSGSAGPPRASMHVVTQACANSARRTYPNCASTWHRRHRPLRAERRRRAATPFGNRQGGAQPRQRHLSQAVPLTYHRRDPQVSAACIAQTATPNPPLCVSDSGRRTKSGPKTPSLRLHGAPGPSTTREEYTTCPD